MRSAHSGSRAQICFIDNFWKREDDVWFFEKIWNQCNHIFNLTEMLILRLPSSTGNNTICYKIVSNLQIILHLRIIIQMSISIETASGKWILKTSETMTILRPFANLPIHFSTTGKESDHFFYKKFFEGCSPEANVLNAVV